GGGQHHALAAAHGSEGIRFRILAAKALAAVETARAIASAPRRSASDRFAREARSTMSANPSKAVATAKWALSRATCCIRSSVESPPPGTWPGLTGTFPARFEDMTGLGRGGGILRGWRGGGGARRKEPSAHRRSLPPCPLDATEKPPGTWMNGPTATPRR